MSNSILSHLIILSTYPVQQLIIIINFNQDQKWTTYGTLHQKWTTYGTLHQKWTIYGTLHQKKYKRDSGITDKVMKDAIMIMATDTFIQYNK